MDAEDENTRDGIVWLNRYKKVGMGGREHFIMYT